MTKRKKVVWIGGLTAAIAISYLWVSLAADRRWSEWDSEVLALEGSMDAADVRPVLYGAETSGSAWDHYAKALAIAVDDEGLEKMVRPRERNKLGREQLETLFAAHAETLTQIRLGAHCRDGHESVDWVKGFEGVAKNLLTTRGLSNLAVTKSLAQIEDGQPVAAVDTLLDMAQLGRDLMHSHLLINEMIGLAIVTIPTVEAVKQNRLLERLSPAALERFSSGLAALDQGMRRLGPSLQGEAVMFAYSVKKGLGDKLGMSTASWRHGFSSRLMAADTGLRMIEFADDVRVAAGGSWSNCNEYLRGIERRVGEADTLFSWNSVMRSALTGRFSTIARLRLLRMAIEYRRGNPVPALADPYGGKLQYEVRDDKRETRFWSVGSGELGRLFLFRRNDS